MSTLRLGRFGTIRLTREQTAQSSPDDEPDTSREDVAADHLVTDEAEHTTTPSATANQPEETASDDDQARPVEHTPRRRRRPSRRLYIAAVITLAAIAVATTVTGVVVGNHNDNARSLLDSQGAQQTIATTVVAMLSYDYADAENQLPTAEKGLTNNFRSDFTNLINATIIPGAKEKQVVTRVSVVGNSVINRTPDRIDLLMFLNQVTTTATEPQPATTGSRVKVTAVHDNGTWLVDSLKPL